MTKKVPAAAKEVLAVEKKVPVTTMAGGLRSLKMEKVGQQTAGTLS